MLNHPFFATLIAHLPTVPRPPGWFLALGAPPTACVDGKRIYFNPEFVEGLTEKQRMGLLAHEVMHPALQHLWRRGNRDPGLWRAAADYVANAILLNARDEHNQPAFELPPNGLHDDRFRGMAVEQVYALLEREAKEQGGEQGARRPAGQVIDGQMEQPIRDDEDAEGEQAKGDGKGQGGKGKGKDEAKADGDKGDGGAGGKDEQGKPKKKDKGAGAGKPEGGDESEKASGKGGAGEAKSADDDKADSEAGKSGRGDEDNAESEPKNDGGQGKDEAAEEEEEGEADDGSSAGCGHAHHDDGPMADDADMKEQWRSLINQAAINARSRGRLPGDIAKLVEDLTQPQVPWQRIVEERATAYKKDDYDMLRQDRRFIESGIYFPDTCSPATSVDCFIDSSGSISDDELHAFASEFVGIIRCRGISTVRLIVCDARVTLDVTLTPYDEIPKHFPGRGGTDFRPPFRRIEEQPSPTRPGFIVYLTDMEGPFPEVDPGIPTLWLASVPEHRSARDLPTPPFGVVVPYQPLLKRDRAA